jgi:hypothetical protein
MVILPDQYVTEKFCQYAGYPKYNKRANAWSGGCPICREGSSWGKKRRIYYKLEKNYIFCFNCGFKGNTIEFIKQVTGMTVNEILNESNIYDTNDVINIIEPSVQKTKTVPQLPDDSINLYDKQQVDWWLNDENTSKTNLKTLEKALQFISNRKLDTAVNRPKTMWLSFSDFVHKNRVTIPFYDKNHRIIFYQSRDILNETDKPKYLSKSGSGKSIFNINQVDPHVDNIYLFEGPLDSCFVKNGVAVAGITNGPSQDLNAHQQQQLEDLRLYKKTWVLDSQWLDSTSLEKTKLLADQNENVFIWPSNIGKRYKDLNDLCIDISKPGIGYKFIDKHTYTGLRARLALNEIPTNR